MSRATGACGGNATGGGNPYGAIIGKGGDIPRDRGVEWGRGGAVSPAGGGSLELCLLKWSTRCSLSPPRSQNASKACDACSGCTRQCMARSTHPSKSPLPWSHFSIRTAFELGPFCFREHSLALAGFLELGGGRWRLFQCTYLVLACHRWLDSQAPSWRGFPALHFALRPETEAACRVGTTLIYFDTELSRGSEY